MIYAAAKNSLHGYKSKKISSNCSALKAISVILKSMSIDASEVFNPKDFESVRLSISFTNLTTKTELKNADNILLIDILSDPRQLGFEMPARQCNIKHNVLFEINKLDQKTGKTSPLVAITGRIIEVEELDADCMKVTVDCVQVDEKSWDDLVNLFAKRQEDINNFLASARP